jgi:hypothetical protein
MFEPGLKTMAQDSFQKEGLTNKKQWFDKIKLNSF